MREKYGFVYIWYDRKHKKFYIGSHWGNESDGYICSSKWMLQAYKRRPEDFKRRILKRVYDSRKKLLEEEQYFLSKIKPEEIKTRYYNLSAGKVGHWSATPNAKTIAQKSGEKRRGVPLGPCSEETKQKISEANKGRTFSEEHKEKLRDARSKQIITEESNKKRSESLKKAYAAGIKKKPKGREKLPPNKCLICGEDTPSRRSNYCKNHRYEAMNKTRSTLPDSKWLKED
jgi:hypothetical protein